MWGGSCCCVRIVFVFFKQKTAYEMRISDWSSDVCSSDLAAAHAEPAVVGPLHGIEQGLAPERPIARLIAVIDAPPIARRPFDQRRVAARPPGLGARFRMDERIVRAIFPRAVDRARPRGDHHMAGRRRSEEHTSELQSLMRTSYAVFCLKKKHNNKNKPYYE